MFRSPLAITLDRTGSTWVQDWEGESEAVVSFGGRQYHTTDEYIYLERNIARRLHFAINKLSPPRLVYSRGALTAGQLDALDSVCRSYYSVLLGPPGTGKTTILRHAAQCPGTVLLATTGAAAVRIGTDVCRTVHSALKYNGFTFNRTIDGARRIFVDECSMLDEPTLFALLKCKSPITFVGDINQLPSVRPGKVLEDLATVAPTAKLTELLRYEPDSEIGKACAAILAGEVPRSSSKFFIDEAEDLVNMSDVATAMSFKARVAALDMLLMTRTNAERMAVNDEFGYEYPYPVMNVTNRYRGKGESRDLHLANGEKGMAIRDGVALFKRGSAKIYMDMDPNIVPAWACTVHKVQGHQSRAIVVGMGSNLAWDRRLLYTAVSRSQEFCTVYGSTQALEAAVRNPGASQRLTLIREFYEEMST